MSGICLPLTNNVLLAKCLPIVFHIETQIQDNKEITSYSTNRDIHIHLILKFNLHVWYIFGVCLILLMLQVLPLQLVLSISLLIDIKQLLLTYG